MADISKLQLPNNTVYDIKDAEARTSIENINNFLDPSSDLGTATTIQGTSGTVTVSSTYNTAQVTMIGGKCVKNEDNTISVHPVDQMVLGNAKLNVPKAILELPGYGYQAGSYTNEVALNSEGRWIYTRNVEKYVINSFPSGAKTCTSKVDGSSLLYYETAATTSTAAFQANYTNMVSTGVYAPCTSSTYGDHTFRYGSSKFVFYTNDYTTLAEMNAVLAENPIIIYAKIATPTTTDVTDLMGTAMLPPMAVKENDIIYSSHEGTACGCPFTINTFVNSNIAGLNYVTRDELSDSLQALEEDIPTSSGSCRFFPVTEEEVTVTTDATKGVAPYATSYGYTNITINSTEAKPFEWVEGAAYYFVIDTKMVVASATRNVRVRIGEDGAWIPVMGATTILAGNSYFLKTQNRIFVYKTTYQSGGALHLLNDDNTTYSYLANSIASTGNPIKIDDNGYGGAHAFLFPTTPVGSTDPRWSGLYSTGGNGSSKTPLSTLKFYADRHYLYHYNSSNVAAGGNAGICYYTYAGMNLNYTANIASSSMGTYNRIFLWLRDFNPDDFTFYGPPYATSKPIIGEKNIKSIFTSASFAGQDIYLFYIGFNTTYNTLALPDTASVVQIYKFNVDSQEMTPFFGGQSEDTKVTQTASTTSGAKPILLAQGDTTATDTASFDADVTVDPGTGEMNATQYTVGGATAGASTITATKTTSGGWLWS